MYSQTDLSKKEKQLKASIVSEEFYGLPAKYYDPQMSIELGIKNNSFKWFSDIKVAGTENCIHTLRKYLWHRNPHI